MSNQQLELFFKLGIDLDNLRKRANVTGRGEVATNPSGVEMRSKASKLDRVKHGEYQSSQSENVSVSYLF